jgi:type VI secretion system protein ImpH
MTARDHPLQAAAAVDRQAELHALFADVRMQPYAHDFFALLRRVEALVPEAPRLGCALRPSQEPLRLGEEPELDFAPASLMRFDAGGAAPRLGVRFFGLLGPHGPMPLHFTEYVRERLYQRGDPTPLRFLDVFHHRLLLLFYRAWAQLQPAVQHDRPHDDRFAAWLGAMVGVDGAARAQDSLPHNARLHQTGLLGARAQSAEGLAKLVAQHFGVPARIVQHAPHWMQLPRDERTRLGHARNRVERLGATPPRLGESASAGSKLWDRQYKFRIVLGPLTLAQYRSFQPGGPAWAQLRDWVREYMGQHLQWDVQLCLAKDEVPAPRLGRRVQAGLTAWLGHGPKRDRADLRQRSDATLRHPGAAP